MKIKTIAFSLMTICVIACEGEKTETDNPVEELNDVLEDLNEELTELEEVSEIYILSDNIAGDFQVGETIPTSSDKFTVEKKTITVSGEEGPYEETVHSVSNDDEELMTIIGAYDFETDTYSDVINEMKIYSDRFQTAEGIGVGSTLAEFMAAYPDYSIWYTYISDMFVIESESLSAQFLLDGNGFEGEIDGFDEMIKLDASDFDPATLIVTVRMFYSGEE